MKSDSVIIVFLLAVIGLLLANMLGWLPQPGGGQPTAAPQVIVVTAVPQPVPVDTAVPPATVTAVPTPAQAHSLQDVFLIYEEAAAPCINAIQMNQQLTAVCQTIRADLIRIAAEQGGK